MRPRSKYRRGLRAGDHTRIPHPASLVQREGFDFPINPLVITFRYISFSPRMFLIFSYFFLFLFILFYFIFLVSHTILSLRQFLLFELIPHVVVANILILTRELFFFLFFSFSILLFVRFYFPPFCFWLSRKNPPSPTPLT